MSSTTSLAYTRALPRFGGFTLGMIRLELRRMVRNKRTVIITLVMPPVLFLLFGTGSSARSQSAGAGNVTGYILVSMAVYGAMLATTSGGAMVSVERAAGWSRQLRLTPLKPVAYVAVKLVLAMIIGLASVVAAFAVGAVSGAKLPVHAWIECGLLAWFAWTIREAVTNVVRHSRASRCAVRLTAGSVEIVDDGVGGPVVAGDGQGLVGLRRRAEALGGTLTVGCRQDEPGFRVRVEVPS
jgi:hypothetical protein